MSILWIMLVSGLVLFLGGRFYAPLIARVLGEQPDRQTPAVTINDGHDYVPTRTPVVFAHHYASIAGAGPIIGPVIAIIYGWGPSLLWILLGGVFLGAVHDYVSTFIAVREGGKNLTVVARRYIGPSAFIMLLIILVAILVLVCAAFLDLSATALTSKVDVSLLQLPADQGLFRVEDGQAIIGGIASTSVVVITACSPLVGFLYLKRKWPVWLCSLMAIGICIVSILVGIILPMPVKPQTWKLMISGYVLISAGLPVWLFLQSRDFINVHILYVGIVFLIVALIAAAIRGGGEIAGAMAIPMNNWTEGTARKGPGWPVLFVTIACGAVSGFHSLCAGGTTCKQLCSEPDARRVGYYGMLLESFLAVCVVCCLMVGLSLSGYKGYLYPQTGSGNAVLTFAMSVGHTAHVGLGLPVAAGALGAMLLLEGFLVTTLDTAIRLTRYMIEEGWATFFSRYDVFHVVTSAQDKANEKDSQIAIKPVGAGGLGVEEPHPGEHTGTTPVIKTKGVLRVVLRFLKLYWFNSGLAVVLMLLLGLGQGYKVLWSIFGSTNQLLAALALLIGTTWLLHRARRIWYTLLPAIFMLITSITMMIRLLILKYLPDPAANLPLIIATIIVLVMTGGILVLTMIRWHSLVKKVQYK
ncbi:MAG: hypothetical protein JW860_12645 [Sedimentisphaerales bacterium]|nr:hypothetical protein [Sedimentisphaerales bacterium]